MSKTVKQIADELGVSKQAVHQKERVRNCQQLYSRLRQRLTVSFTYQLTVKSYKTGIFEK